MRHPDFARVTTWVFDLDNTLYPPEMRLFDQIEARMNAWVRARLGLGAAEADALRRDYWARFGTTLNGLMQDRGIDPWEFLSDVHDIDFSAVTPDPRLAARLAALPGRRIVHTNADAVYAARVLEARGLSGLFDAVYGIEHTGFRPKPGREAFDAVIAADGYDPARAAMFEDDVRNLAVPHVLGMATVLIAPAPDPKPHVGHQAADLSAFLGQITGA
jgi:putative hydrolase of the HAD superfamily